MSELSEVQDALREGLEKRAGWTLEGWTLGHQAIAGRSATIGFDEENRRVIIDGVGARVKWPFEMILERAENPGDFVRLMLEARHLIFWTERELEAYLVEGGKEPLPAQRMQPPKVDE